MREGLRVAAKHDVHVVQLAIHLDPLRGDGEVIVGGGPLLLRAVFRVRHHVDLLHELPVGFVGRVGLGDEFAEIADDRAEVLAGRDHAPSADRVKADGNRLLRQERGSVPADDRVRMVDSENEECFAVGGAAAVRALGLPRREFVGSERVLGPEIAGTDAVGPAEKPRRLGGSKAREAGRRTGLSRSPCPGRP